MPVKWCCRNFELTLDGAKYNNNQLFVLILYLVQTIKKIFADHFCYGRFCGCKKVNLVPGK